MATYLGPASTFTYKEHVYLPGENVPMSKELLERAVADGHYFEGVEPAGGANRRSAPPREPTPPPVMRFDDRGQGHLVERAEKREPVKADAAK
jgi:hypothetical protein